MSRRTPAPRPSTKPPKPMPKITAAKPPLPPRQTPIVVPPAILVARKYESQSWTVITMSRHAGTDLIARHGSHVHFVRVADDTRTTGVAAGAFIQNAFSNAARPVYAHIAGGKITLTDANTNQRVLLKSATTIRR